jgi:hypothetical protein
MAQYLPTISGQDGMFQDDALMQIDLKRKLAMADALRQQEAPQGQMVSGIYVAPSWTQQLAGLADTYVAGKQEKEAMQQYNDAQQSKAQKLGDLMKGQTVFEADAQGNQREVQKPYTNEQLIGELSKIDSGYAPKLFENYLSKRMAAAQPQKLGANEALVIEQPGGGYKNVYTNTVDKPEAMSSLGRLQGERAKLFAANPSDPRIREIDNAILKETTFAPAANTYVNMPKVETSARVNANEDFTKNVYRPVQDSARNNAVVASRLDALESLPINEQTGWGTEAKSTAASILVGLGYNNEDAKSLASNAQTFKSIQARQVNDELNAAKGPQTEGDAQRAKTTYASLGNTPQANKYINDLQRAIIKRKNSEAKYYRENYDRALNEGDLSRLERDWMSSPEASRSIFDYPEMKKWSNLKAAPGAGSPSVATKRYNPATGKMEAVR